MRIDIKAKRRGKSQSIDKAVSEVRLRADSDNDAAFLVQLGELVQRPVLIATLARFGMKVVEGKLSERDHETLRGIYACDSVPAKQSSKEPQSNSKAKRKTKQGAK